MPFSKQPLYTYSILSFVCLGVAIYSGTIRADDSGKNDVPTPPYLQRIPPHTEWTATYALKAPGGTSPSAKLHVQSVLGYKAQEDIHLINEWSTGVKTDVFVVGGLVFTPSNPKYPSDIQVFDSAQAGLATPGYDLSDFPELDWVGAPYFTQKAMEDGRDCYVYERTAEQMMPLPDDIILTPEQKKSRAIALAKIQPQKAWIDAKTGLPVKFDVGGGNFMIYTFSQNITKPILPSPVFQVLMMARAHRLPR